MTKEEVQNTIETNQLPSDHLDNFWNNFLGMSLPILLVLIFGYFSFIATPTETSASKKSTLALFFIALLWLSYSLIKKLREKKLTKFKTNQSIERNIDAIEKLLRINKKLELLTKENSCYYINIPSILNFGCTLVLIPQNNHILFNIRFNGSSRGRPQYSLGQIAFNRWKIKRKIKNYL